MTERTLADFPVLHTARLTLRLPTKMDAEALLAVKRDAPDAQDLGDDLWEGLPEAERYVENFEARWIKDIGIGWGIALQSAPDRLIGSCQLHSPESWSHSVQLDYELHVDHWGHGHASEALHAVLEYGMSDRFSFTLNRVWALTETTNERSIRLLRRLGFLHEGTLRDFAHVGGRFRDYESYSLLRREFERLSSP